MDKVSITIIGSGVVGLAIARELSGAFKNIVVIERNDGFGKETSSRSSEVIHSGIYYPENSLKASLCVSGARLLYEYCHQNEISYSKTGQLIVATEEEEMQSLQELYRRGINNGVIDLSILDKGSINKIESNVKAVSAIFSPHTGIFDSHSFMKHLYNSANSAGVLFSFNTEAGFIGKRGGGYIIGIKNEDYKFYSTVVINSAGLYSDRIAELAGIDIDKSGYRLRFCKGSYFSYAKRSPVKRLIYPVPNKDLKGLGIHATVDLTGRLRFGPDAEFVDNIDYKVNQDKREVFYKSACRIINGLDKEYLMPDTSGIRPQIKGEGIKDFIIRHEVDTGLEGLINLIGIESPGLTASLAIAKRVREMVSSIL